VRRRGTCRCFDINSFVLTLTAGASTTLDGVWGLPGGTLAGLTIGTASVAPVVPEPATWGLLALGLAAAGLRRRRALVTACASGR
jgi:hypothetical protein